MLITKSIKVPYTNDNSVIEDYLHKMGVVPLRWAIVAIDNENMTLTVSFEK